MADHSDFLALARELIQEEGRSVTFAKLDTTAADADKPWRGAGSPTLVGQVTTMAVFLPDGSGFGKLIEDEELFKKSEQLLLVAPPNTGEDLSDYNIVVDDSVRWKIAVTKCLKPASLALLFAMGVSR